ncbi:MAG: very short patch repair endonuclease [Bryobacteraceae bacterium]
MFSKGKRSAVMSSIRGKGNRSTERRMAAMLRARAISGWQMHRKDIPGKPDFYFPERRLALFIDGCFWHQCPKCAKMPTQNGSFWNQKLTKNARRDKRIRRALNRSGISVIRLWEHDLERQTTRCRAVLDRLAVGLGNCGGHGSFSVDRGDALAPGSPPADDPRQAPRARAVEREQPPYGSRQG